MPGLVGLAYKASSNPPPALTLEPSRINLLYPSKTYAAAFWSFAKESGVVDPSMAPSADEIAAAEEEDLY